VIAELGHQHVREERLGRHPAGDRPFGSGCLHHRLLAGTAGVAGSADHLHPQLRRDDVEHLARVLADHVQAPPQQGQLLSSTSTSTSTRGRCAGKAPRLRRRPGAAEGAAPRHLLLRRLGGRGGLLEVLQAELQLVGVEALRAPAELARAAAAGSRAAASRSRHEPRCARQDSITLDLERSCSGAFRGNDFSHMSQLL
jgi:hypothetical protein